MEQNKKNDQNRKNNQDQNRKNNNDQNRKNNQDQNRKSNNDQFFCEKPPTQVGGFYSLSISCKMAGMSDLRRSRRRRFLSVGAVPATVTTKSSNKITRGK